MTRALVFDCDGVLADTELDGHLPAFNATFAQFGIPVIWNVDEYRELTKIGGGKERMRTLFDDPEVVRAAGLPTDPAKQDELLRTWHACKTVKFTEAIAQGQVTPRPGIRRVVEAAAEAGWRLSVASTSAADAVRAVLISAVGTDLAATFDPVLAGDVVAHKKPAPDIYLLAREVLGLAAEDILVIEDSGVGSQAAHAAGLTAVVTVSPLTRDDNFPASPLIVSCLGDPAGVHAEVLQSAIGDLTADVVTVDDLERCFGWGQ